MENYSTSTSKTPVHIFIASPSRQIQNPFCGTISNSFMPARRKSTHCQINSDATKFTPIARTVTLGEDTININRREANLSMQNRNLHLKQVTTDVPKLELTLLKPKSNTIVTKKNSSVTKNMKILIDKAKQNSLERMQTQKTRLWKALLRSVIRRAPLENSMESSRANRSPLRIDVSLQKTCIGTTKVEARRSIRFPIIECGTRKSREMSRSVPRQRPKISNYYTNIMKSRPPCKVFVPLTNGLKPFYQSESRGIGS